MTWIERTAYPRLPRAVSLKELRETRASTRRSRRAAAIRSLIFERPRGQEATPAG